MANITIDPTNLIQVLSDGSLQIREIVGQEQVINGVTLTNAVYHRYVLHPGDSLDGKDPKIVAIANSIWTADVIAAWQASISSNNL